MMSQTLKGILRSMGTIMTMKLSPWIRQQFFDNNGLPLAGGLVTFYVAGSTSLKKNTYQDYLGATANENPIELDSSGVAKIFGAGMYDVVITDANGALIEQVLGVDFGGGETGFGTFVVVDNYDALRNLQQDYDVVYVLGRNVAFDGGEGIFQRTTLSDADDDGIILVRGISSHYFRVLDDVVKAEWYGVAYDSSVNQSTFLLNALEASKTWNLPCLVTGNVFISSKMTVKSGTYLKLDGALTGPSAGIEVHFATGAKFEGSKDCFSNGVNATFEAGVVDAIRLSWFTEGTDMSRWTKAIKSTQVGYDLLVDINTTLSANLSVPKILTVNFTGASKIIVSGLMDLDIETLNYQGTAEIVHYQDISYIGAVKVGSSYCYLEWFGGVAGSALDTDNSIAFKAAVKHGDIFLISNAGTFYNIPAGTYANANGLVMLGNYIPNNNSVNDSVPSTIRLAEGAALTVGEMTLTGIKIIGSGSITATETTINDAIIASTVSYATGLSKVNDSLAIDPEYIVVGGSGKIASTTDPNGSWSTESTSATQNLNSIAKNSNIYVLVGANGLIQTSPDGATWTTRTSGVTVNLNKVKWIAAVSKFIAVGESGWVLSSVDGISWNAVQTAIASAKSITYFNSKYVIVGSSGQIYTSTDLASWTLKTITGVTNLLYSVDASDTLMVLVGANGTIATSTDAVNFTTRIAPVTGSLLSVKYYSDSKLWIVTGTNGIVLKSSTGIEYAAVNTYQSLSDSIYDQIKVNGQYVFAAGSGYVLTSYDMVKFNKVQAVNGVNNLGIAAAPSKILAIGDAGAIAVTEDGVNYTLQTPATTKNLNRARKIGSKYFIMANDGIYLVSGDGVSWSVKSSGTQNLYDIVGNADNSKYIVVGANGYMATSPDAGAIAPIWTAVTTGVASDLTQLFYNGASTSQKFMAVGNAGVIMTSADGSSWNVASQTSNGMISNGTLKMIFGNNGLVVTSTDGITWSKMSTGVSADLHSGVYTGGLFVLVGSNGTIITSADGVTWTTRTSGTTQSINSLVHNGSMFVAVGDAGVALRSTDGLTWTVLTVGSGLTFKRVRYINGTLVAVGTTGAAGAIYTSTDAVTWTSQTSSTDQTIYDIVWDGGKYIYAAGSGVIKYGSMGSWTVATASGVTQNLYALYFENGVTVAAGANGIMLASGNGTKFDSIDSPVTENIHDLTKIGGVYYGIGDTFTVIKSTELMIWKNYIHKPTAGTLKGVFADGKWVLSNTINVFALDVSTLLYSTDGIVWNVVNLETAAGSNVQFVNSKFTMFGYADSAVTYTSADVAAITFAKNIINSLKETISSIAVGTVNGNNLTVYFTALGNAITGTSGNASFSVSKVALRNVIASVKITNTDSGDISQSNLYDIAVMGRTADTEVSDFTGTLTGTMSRCTINFSQSVGIGSDIIVSDTKFVNKSGKKLDVFSLASTVASLVLNNCNIVSSGSMLVYSENVNLKIVVEGGTIAGGNLTALTNGYAKIYLNNAFDENGDKIENISAYSLDGDVLDSDLVTHMASASLTGDVTHWYHAQKANLSIESGAIKANSPIAIASEIDSANALRFRWGGVTALRFLKNFGGRIKTTIQFPAGADKDVQAKTKIKAQMYIPEYTVTCYDYDTLVYTGKVNNSYLVGRTVSMGSSVDAAKLINHANVWSGRQDMLYGAMVFGSRNDRYGKNGVVDVYGDVSYKPASSSVLLGHDYESGSYGGGTVSGDVSHEAYIVLTSEDNVILPVGTTVKVELELAIPASMKMFNKFYNADNNYELDTVSGIERVYLHYKGLEDNTFKVAIVKNALSETKNEKAYLSVTDAQSTDPTTHVTTYYQVPDSYKWSKEQVPGYPDGYYYREYLQYMKPENTLEFSYGEIGYDIEITINGLYNSTMAAKSFAGSQSGSITVDNVQVSGNSGTLGGTRFIHSIWKHVKLLNMSFFDQIDKVITKKYYNGLR